MKVLEDLVRSADSYNTITAFSTSGATTKSSIRTQHTILQRSVEEPTTLSSGSRMVQLLEDLNESMAKNTNVLVNMSKENSQRHGETTKSIETVHTLLNTWHKNEPGKTNPPNQPPCKRYGTDRVDGETNRQNAPSGGCFYCWVIGHYIAHCDLLAADVAEGKVQTLENGTRVDLKTVPREPSNLSPRERVDRQWKNRKQYFTEDANEDSIVDLIPNGLVTLQPNRNVHDKKDEYIFRPDEQPKSVICGKQLQPLDSRACQYQPAHRCRKAHLNPPLHLCL